MEWGFGEGWGRAGFSKNLSVGSEGLESLPTQRPVARDMNARKQFIFKLEIIYLKFKKNYLDRVFVF